MAEGAAPRQARRLSRWVVLIGMAALSACQVVPHARSRPQPLPTPPPITATASEPVNPSLPNDARRNRVALLVPITGTNAGVGESIANAANMAVLDSGGRTIRVTTYDTAGGAAAAARKAIAEGNRLILGPLLAEDVRAVAPVARAAGVPVVTFSNDTGLAGNGVFVMGFAPSQSIARIVSYARTQGVSRFAGLVPTGLYGQRASTAFVRDVEVSGGQVVAMQTFDRSAGGISVALSKLTVAGPYDALMIADSGRVAVQAASLMRARGGSARVLGTELWNADRAIGSSPALRGAWFASVSDAVYGQLAAKYRVRFGKGPYRLASLGYDSVLLVNRIGSAWRFGDAFPVVAAERLWRIYRHRWRIPFRP